MFPIQRRDGKVGDVALGRGTLMDIKLDAQSVSSRHAVFKPPGDGRSRWVVVDTVSTNGTFVDGVRIATGREVELSEATVIRFGHLSVSRSTSRASSSRCSATSRWRRRRPPRSRWR